MVSTGVGFVGTSSPIALTARRNYDSVRRRKTSRFYACKGGPRRIFSIVVNNGRQLTARAKEVNWRFPALGLLLGLGLSNRGRALASTTPVAFRAATWSDAVRYRLETFLTWHLGVQTGFLWAIFFFLVGFGGFLYQRTTGFETGKAYWRAWCSLSGAEPDFSEDPWRAKLVVSVLTVLQFIFFAFLISFVENSVNEKLQEFKNGRTAVVESGHEVVLGWNSRLPRVLRQVAIAGSSNRERVRVVILAPRAKEVMDSQIQEFISRGEFKDVTVICRTGDPASSHDQKMVAIDKAAKVVILSESDDSVPSMVADNLSFTTALALKHAGVENKSHERIRTIVETRGLPHTSLVSRLGPHVTQLNWPDLASRHLVKCVMQPLGLANVHRDLLDFDGVETYIQSFPELAGTTVLEASGRLKGGILTGLIRQAPGGIILNPDYREVIRPTDRLLMLSADKTRTRVSKATGKPREVPEKDGRPRRTLHRLAPRRNVLVIGWRPGMSSILDEIEGSVGSGSEVTILGMNSKDDREQQLRSEHFDCRKRLTQVRRLTLLQGDPCDPQDLEQVNLRKFDSIIVLLDHSSAARNNQQREARVVETLAGLRILLDRNPRSSPANIVAEVFDAKRESLARAENPDTTVVSLDEFSALLLAQAAYEPEVLPVLRTLLSQSGPEIALRAPSWAFAALQQDATDFASLSDAVRIERGETLLGYLTHNGSLVLNPPHSAHLTPNSVRHLVSIANDTNAIWTAPPN